MEDFHKKFSQPRQRYCKYMLINETSKNEDWKGNEMERKKFKELVFERDSHKCLFCDLPAIDAHHIMERRLFDCGGYELNNGASVCAEHHLSCERTDISVEDILERIGLKFNNRFTPEHLYSDQSYDKWGNPILENGNRLKGELFYDESVQKILSDKLHLFQDEVKYPRSYHCPWSENHNNDDKVQWDMSNFEGKEVVVTEKLDGENTSFASNFIHARSIDGRSHWSRNWVKNFHSQIAHDIPKDFRICGENMYAKHSILYNNLETYFYCFSVWENLECLSWDDTLEWFELLTIAPVPILYKGPYDENIIRSLWNEKNWENCEGYTIRLSERFHYRDFSKSLVKFVRKDHIQTINHWMRGSLETNILKGT